MFKGRKLLIATKHQKEKVIAPILERALGVSCFVIADLDTDQFGTFTGSITRKDTPVNTAKNKCLFGMELASCDLAVASEGSFGPHPSLYFVPADDECLVFIDKKNDLEIVERTISLSTNFKAAEISSEADLAIFCEKVKFPSHGLIVRKDKDDILNIVKGIADFDVLIGIYRAYFEKFGKVYVETDMRATYNPTRMEVIKSASIKLADKINSFCPMCQYPGFGVTDFIQGLPCSQCHLPTQSTLSFLHTCLKCSYKMEEKYPHKKFEEDPMYCDYCNP